ARNGYLAFKNNLSSSGPLFENVDWSRTKAYALGFNSIYINLKGREGKGIVESDIADSLCNEIIKGLEQWYDGNIPVITKAYKSKDIYNTRYNNGPDLVIGYNRGYRASKQTVLGSAPDGLLIEDNHELWSGDHCCDPELVPGVLFGANIQSLPDNICVVDIANLISKVFFL
ncbi:MAG: nucleotide pyrophosphatase, partial [Candidatus Nitrosotenuis sp.]